MLILRLDNLTLIYKTTNPSQYLALTFSILSMNVLLMLAGNNRLEQIGTITMRCQQTKIMIKYSIYSQYYTSVHAV